MARNSAGVLQPTVNSCRVPPIHVCGWGCIVTKCLVLSLSVAHPTTSVTSCNSTYAYLAGMIADGCKLIVERSSAVVEQQS